MQAQPAFVFVQKADALQRGHERAFLTTPVHGQLDVLVFHAGQIAVRTHPRRIGPKLEQRHDALVAQTPPELLGLVMGEKIDGYAKIGIHPHFPQRHLA